MVSGRVLRRCRRNRVERPSFRRSNPINHARRRRRVTRGIQAVGRHTFMSQVVEAGEDRSPLCQAWDGVNTELPRPSAMNKLGLRRPLCTCTTSKESDDYLLE